MKVCRLDSCPFVYTWETVSLCGAALSHSVVETVVAKRLADALWGRARKEGGAGGISSSTKPSPLLMQQHEAQQPGW